MTTGVTVVMREYELEVLEQYPIEVSSTRKVRGAYFCETDQGIFLLENMNFAAGRAPLLHELDKSLYEKGFACTDRLAATKAGAFYSVGKDGTKYVLKHWFSGRECEVRREGDVLQAVQMLAKLHRILLWKEPDECAEPDEKAAMESSEPEKTGGRTEAVGTEITHPFVGKNLRDAYQRHNTELLKIRKFIRSRVTKNEFERLYMSHCEEVVERAKAVTRRLELSGYDSLYRQSVETKSLVHGDYNYHNVLFLTSGIAVTNFQHFHIDVQMEDLYYFMRKVLEKNRWNQSLGMRMLRSYEAIRPVSETEREYLAIRLAYPEKFWKIMNTYYHSNKAWIPEKNLDKLKIALLQREDREKFLKQVFSFHV
ncbi:MAG: MarR family transcriptional regulator [Hespellia sp.]|nr:MarR family transcriptional regulator [Hespellia sp.]